MGMWGPIRIQILDCFTISLVLLYKKGTRYPALNYLHIQY